MALLATAWPAISHADRPSPRSDPLDVRVPVPPVVHASALAGYRGLDVVPVGSWRAANDTVNRIGGWRAYAREANQPEVPAVAAPGGTAITPAARPALPARPPGPGHDGHQTR